MKEYHILSLSGGKDSTALAFFMKENMPDIFEKLELVFCDTEHEIPETYDYLNKIEIFLGKQITTLIPEKSFDHLYDVRKFLPSLINRWCTVELKINVYEKFLKEKFLKDKNNLVNTYVGIRADELGRGVDSRNPRIIVKYPFQEYGICRDDIFKILEKNGIGIPEYYKWRKRSGCYFCMFQSKMDWINLYENHPDLFFKAMKYEKFNDDESKKFGWNIDMPLKEMIKKENIKTIKEDYNKQARKIVTKESKLMQLI